MKESWFGEEAGEKRKFFFSDKKYPFIVYATGITNPNPDYFIRRDNIDYFDIEYIQDGEGYLEIDNKKFTLKKGDAYILEPGFGHVYYPDQKHPYKKVWLAFFSPFYGTMLKAFGLNRTFVFHNCEFMAKLMDEVLLLSDTSNSSDDISFRIGSIISEITFKLAEEKQEINVSKISRVALDTKNILDASIFINISLSEIAAKLNYSTKQVYREFLKYYGVTPTRYLMSNKIDVAKSILLSTNTPIKEIADRLHFDNQHYFCFCFKKEVGMSPREYRQKSLK